MPTFVVKGQEIYARDEGPRNGQIALLLHGWSSSWYANSTLIPLLSQRYRCLAVDLPGYGNSPAPKDQISIPLYADLLAGLLRQVTSDPVVLVGHSMGGMTSVTMALRYPDLVERMVLIGPTISGKLSTYINLMVSPITWLEGSWLGAKVSGFLERQFVSLTDRIMRPALFAERTGIDRGAFERIKADARRPGQGRVRAECFEAMRRNNLSGQLERVEAPTLIIWGAEDNTVPLRDAGIVADEWPAADLRIIPKASHWPQFETLDATRRYVAGFLGLALEADVPEPVQPVSEVQSITQFLSGATIATGLNDTQRWRLAEQLSRHKVAAGQVVARLEDSGKFMFIVERGQLLVTLPTANGEIPVATLQAGQLAGELALLDAGTRSALLRTGPEGATVLVLRRDHLVALCESDSELATRVLWNIGATLARRLRTTLRSQAAEASAPAASSAAVN